MIAKTLNLQITQGRDFSRTLTFYNDYDAGTKLDISGYTFKAQIREQQDQASTLLATFTMTVTTATSTVVMELTDSDTADLPPGIAWWDLVVTVGGNSQSWLGGQAIIKGGPTEV